ncbi:hypothetical protein [Thermococcus sp.]
MGVDYYVFSIFIDEPLGRVAKRVGENFQSLKFGDRQKILRVLGEEGTTLDRELELIQIVKNEAQSSLEDEDFKIWDADLILGGPLGDYLWLNALYITWEKFIIAQFSSRLLHRVPDNKLGEFVHELIKLGAKLVGGWNDGQKFMDDHWELYQVILKDLKDGALEELYSRLMVVDGHLLPLEDGIYVHRNLEDRLLVVEKNEIKLVSLNPTPGHLYRNVLYALPRGYRLSDFLRLQSGDR